MQFNSTRIPYRQTHAFPGLALDYIDQKEQLKQYYAHPPALAGIQDAIRDRKKFNTNRELLVKELQTQYTGLETSAKVKENISSLLSENTFTITTAHQNNIFLGPLFFIYKIIHVIKVADELNTLLPANHFVPVFYIGTEDADFEELNHIYVQEEKLTWNTNQTGAVGRMKADKELAQLISRLEGELSVLPKGKEIISLLKKYYQPGTSIQQATFEFVNDLFAAYGLVVLLPDNLSLKKTMIPLFEDELLHHTAQGIVEKTATALFTMGYKTQAHARDINLFYLKEEKRDRISKKGKEYPVVDSKIKFNQDEILKELHSHPERFSPNVILRGLYQETILPDILFAGGAGEIAYWLQLRDLFTHYKIPYPVLLLRNSFLLVEKKWQRKIAATGFTTEDFFDGEETLTRKYIARESGNKLALDHSLHETENMYRVIKKQIESIDVTLEKHVEALKQKTLQRLQELEKKMIRAEKRKYTDRQRQIYSIRENLFPAEVLQERHENFCYYYALWGREFISQLYEHSPSLEQEFVILEEA